MFAILVWLSTLHALMHDKKEQWLFVMMEVRGYSNLIFPEMCQSDGHLSKNSMLKDFPLTEICLVSRKG